MKLATIAVGTAVLALAACGPRTQVDREGNVTIKGADGTVITAGKNAATNLPDYVKLYPGAQVTSNVNAAGKGGVVTFTVSAAPETVMDFYKREAAAANLTAAMDTASMDATEKSGAHVISFSDPASKRSMTTTVQQVAGVTQVSLIYGQQ